ncbi:hypothetical protein F5B20DRAFT_277377 [Whalleya microplaca]|nr:hypothetical protein F5B20DRAFT_277377 [Whalleya microplaca]
MLASNQLKTLLAMPASLRPVLFGVPLPVRPGEARLFSTSPRDASKYPNIAAFLMPELQNAQPAELTPEELFKTSVLPSAPDEPLPDELTSLFTKNPPTFYYGEQSFYKLKKNTRIPEVCILGRSNVGKSSFVNALANRNNKVLAYVSNKAGKTRLMNTYGFGPAPSRKQLAAEAAEYKGKEDIPTHSFYLVDMPGYGYGSLKEWGHNITLYLTKRVGVKGAIVLIDAEVGPKQTDLQLLELLSAANKKTAIILTKADKVKGGVVGLRKTCTKLLDALYLIEKQLGNYAVWEKEIFVTAVGARDHNVVTSTVATGRLAVARLAGLAQDTRPKPEKHEGFSGKIISFDDLQYAAAPTKSSTPTSPESAAPRQQPVPESRHSPPSRPRIVDPFEDLKRASNPPSRRRAFCTLLQAHAFHNTTPMHNNDNFDNNNSSNSNNSNNNGNPNTNNPTPTTPPSSDPRAELAAVLQQFIDSLHSSRDPVREHIWRIQEEREVKEITQHGPQGPQLFETRSRRRAQSLRDRYPEQTARVRAVAELRLRKEQRRQERAALRGFDDDEAARRRQGRLRAEQREREIAIRRRLAGEEGREFDGAYEEEALSAEDEEELEREREREAFRNEIQGLAGAKRGKKREREKERKKGGGKGGVDEPMDEFEAEFMKKRR